MKTCPLRLINVIAAILVIVGGLNWGLIGIHPDLNVLRAVITNDWALRIVYMAVGLSAVWHIFSCMCKKKCHPDN